MEKKQTSKKRIIIFFSMTFLVVSVGLQSVHAFAAPDYTVNYEYINIKDMATANVTVKNSQTTNVLDDLLNLNPNNNVVKLSSNSTTPQAIELPLLENTLLALEVEEQQRQIWYLPTEYGRITQYPSYGHAAYDITSPRGSNELIFPVANGVVSSIYTDSAGALVVTVLHEVNGQKYTSLYAHLSRYAEGLYVGKPVTENDYLGYMGTTGYSTGVHLHLVLIDCALFDPNDPYCKDLNGYFRYTKKRITEDYYGLGVMMYVPNQWWSR